MTLPPPILGADPLRQPPPGAGAAGAPDPFLDGYGPGADEPEGEAAGIPVGPAEVTALLVGLFDGLAMARGPHWRAEPDEFAMAAPALARELNKPDTTVAAWLASHGDTLLIVVGLGFVVVPRAALEWQILRLRRDQLRAEAETAPQYEGNDGNYAPRHPQPFSGAGPDESGPTDWPPPGGAGDGVYPAGDGETAMGRPSDPGAVAASIGGIIGR